jgi:hypothetical protein
MEKINMHIIISHFGVRLEYLKMRAPPRNLDKIERNQHLCLLGFLLSLISSEYIQYLGPYPSLSAGLTVEGEAPKYLAVKHMFF